MCAEVCISVVGVNLRRPYIVNNFKTFGCLQGDGHFGVA